MLGKEGKGKEGKESKGKAGLAHAASWSWLDFEGESSGKLLAGWSSSGRSRGVSV